MVDKLWEKASPVAEVQDMVEPEIIRQIRDLAARGWGAKRIARELEVARNTVRRYLRGGSEAEVQVRPGRRRLDDDGRAEARQLYASLAGANAVVVARELRQRGVEASVRTVQRAVADQRRERFAADAASVRFETDPGQQMQIDFGQKVVRIGGKPTRVHLLVSVLCHSRRLFVKAFLSERQDDWREGIAAAFRHFGGVPRTLLGDNARALVVGRDRETSTVAFHPAYVAFCRDWGVLPRACGPYRARTKGKTEAGVKYVKRNGLAEREFASFEALEAHLAAWMVEADQRIHGTTHEPPIVRFERDERHALRPLPTRPVPVREQRLRRRVANDALVDVDTVRYSVPHRLVRDTVEVALGEREVRIYRGAELVARHERSFEPHARVIDKAHYEGLWRVQPAPLTSTPPPSPLEALGRRLSDYAAVLEEVAS
jgi:transposase